MFTIQSLVKPETIEEAYKLLVEKRNNTILGGCAFLRMGSRAIVKGIDLSNLNLDYVRENDDYIEIGAMTTFREVETHPLLTQYFNGVLQKAVGNIIGIQFRNVVTVGATVFSKYGFSDLITALLALEAEIELYNGGRMSLENFLEKSYEKDILTKIFIKKNNRKAVYKDIRISASDYPVLNLTVSRLDNKWIIVVGARPFRAKIATKASYELSKESLTDEHIEKVASMASEELNFGSNMRGSQEYRKAMCQALAKRAIKEVLQCK